MVENRKLFYAISVLLLSCCQIITMFPHNVEQEQLSGISSNTGNNDAYSGISKNPNNNFNSSSVSDGSNNSEYNRANVDSTSNQSYGTTDDDSEFIIAVERKLQTMEAHNEGGGFGQSNVGVWEASPDSVISENVDDLIFLDKRPINQHQHPNQQQSHREYVVQLPPRANEMHEHHYRGQHSLFQIHHHLSADGLDSGSSSSSDEHSSDSLTNTAYASSSSTTSLLSDKASKDAIDDDVGAGETEAEAVPDVDAVADADADALTETESDAELLPHEIELQTDNNEEDSMVVIPLDLSDFLSLIPAERVKAIVANYYLNDPEVQRAYAFMSSRDFASLKHHIVSIPEMSAFLRYLNSSGLDLVNLVTALSTMTTVPGSPSRMRSAAVLLEKASMPNETNDIEYAQKQSNTAVPTAAIGNSVAASSSIEIQTQLTPSSATATGSATTRPLPASPASPAGEATAAAPDGAEPSIAMTAATTIDMETTTMREQLNGLHGLVDGILDVLPQDQILATFFDKLESSEQFSKLVDNIGSPEFAKILNNMQNSVPLRNLIFTLHNNGIYVIRIVDSLKSYFFLGGF